MSLDGSEFNVATKLKYLSENMYREYLYTSDQALVHLAFHCSLKDGELGETEMDFLSSTFVSKGINKALDLKEEMQHYRSYYRNINDETGYLKFLIDMIKPRRKLALFAFCAEIIYQDNSIAIPEEVLLNKVADLLNIRDNDSMAIQNLIAELNAVEKDNSF